MVTLETVLAMNAGERKDLKHRIQTDHYFVADEILREPRFPALVYSVHGRIAETFPTPIPGKPVEEWATKRTRICLAPRGTLKSVIAAVWLMCVFLCCPNTRVLILSGDLVQAEAICRQVQLHLQHPVIQELFPEYKAKGRHPITPKEYWCPARQITDSERNPSIGVSTFWSVRGGRHASILLLDDITNETTANETAARKNLESWADTTPVLNPNGLVVCLATRYMPDELDLPIVMLNEDPDDCVLNCLPIWTVKTEGTTEEVAQRKERQRKFKLEPSDVNFLWDRLNTKKLWTFYRNHPKQFYAQYLMSPQEIEAPKVVFGEGLITQQVCNSYSLTKPHLTEVYINVDGASVGGDLTRTDDICVQVFLRDITNGRITLVDGILDVFLTSTELHTAVVDLIAQWRPKLVRFESASGSQLGLGEILSLGRERGLDLRDVIIFETPSNVKDAKKLRIFALGDGFAYDRVRIYEHYRDVDALKQQLAKVTPLSKMSARNDCADGLAQGYEWLSKLPVELLTPEQLKVPAPSDFESE